MSRNLELISTNFKIRNNYVHMFYLHSDKNRCSIVNKIIDYRLYDLSSYLGRGKTSSLHHHVHSSSLSVGKAAEN